MMLSVIQWVIFISIIQFASSGRVLWQMKERAREVQVRRAQQHVMLRALSTRRPVAVHKEGHVRQPLDHFNDKNGDAVSQRFFVNEAFWQRPYGPVFLYIGGEGPLSEFSVLAGHHVDMAEQHGALLVALEHRFYGSSINPGGLETHNLQYLSSQQALADLAAFHLHISQKYGLSQKNAWICFGGSYAGALSAWFRGKFPHLIYGAVASSAPVRAKLDFSTYNKVVGFSLNDNSVGGSDKCLNDIWEAFAALEAALLGGNETQVAKDFGCCDTPRTLQDKTELVQSLADIVMGTVQYNEEGAALTIARLCDIMTNQSETYEQEEEAYDRLVKLAAIYRSTGEEPCLDVSYDKTVLSLNKTTDARSGYRQWFYQTCNEFGFYQTCEDASCPFSRMLTLQSQTQLCPLLFAVPQGALQSNIDLTNQYYGGDQPRYQRVLYINGDIDPWMELSVVRNGSSVDAVVIRGTAHCADMNPQQAGDKPTLRRARQEIEDHVTMWLKSAAWENLL